jgi:phage-related protein
MRLRDETGIARAIYVAATGRRLVILHVFRKKTQETPQQAIRLALKRMERL